MTGYTTRDVARILDLTPRQVRGYARSGVLAVRRGPRNEYRFTFPDIILLRAARELRERDIPTRRIRSALRRLRDQLPEGRPLTAVHISARGDQVVVRDRGTVWEPETGQVAFDFSVEELAARVEPFADAVARPGEAAVDADAWYDRGVELEAVSPARAREAYRRALEVDPDHPEAHLNLGRLLHEEGDLAGAEGLYRRAGALDPRSGLPAFNLGVVMEDRGRTGEAEAAYRRALERDPELAAAHFNLARIREAAGDGPGALRHLAEYRRLRGGGAGGPGPR